MRTFYRVALAAGGILTLSFAVTPLAYARQGGDDGQETAVTTTSEDNPTKQATDDNPGAGSGSQDAPDAKVNEPGDDSTGRRQEAQRRADDAKQRVSDAQEKVKQRRQEAKEKGATRLEAAKLRMCERRQGDIDSIMGRIGKRGGNHIGLISTVAERVDAYRQQKGLNIENYDALKAAVDSAKASAQTAADAADAAKNSFACDSEDPNGMAADFKNLVQARNDAIKAYRDAVKQLVEAVKAAAKANAATSSTADGGTQ